MKRIVYLSLLLALPFLLHADNRGRNRLNGKWISPYYNTQIKIRVKRHEIKVRGLSRRGWTYFTPIRRNVFEDCRGNRIRLKNIHELVYVNRFRGERIRFVKRGHRNHNHVCNSRCNIDHDFFAYPDYDGWGHGQGDGYYEDWGYGDGFRDRGRNENRNRNGSFSSNNRMDGEYFVRELDEYVTINSTRNGLRAKRKDGKWVNYSQNRYRKNEYVDKNGNKYLVRSDGDITWKSKNGNISLNLQKKRRF